LGSAEKGKKYPEIDESLERMTSQKRRTRRREQKQRTKERGILEKNSQIRTTTLELTLQKEGESSVLRLGRSQRTLQLSASGFYEIGKPLSYQYSFR
jgi:hypothetical protein